MTGTASGGETAVSFPPGFVWGAATASYQIEGAVDEDGRGPSTWDIFSHTPGKIVRGDTGDVACDAYHRFKEDVALMASIGLSAYRFSISWPRIQPGGKGPANQLGVDYYRALIDELHRHGIAPVPTLFHWDLPQELQDEGGWALRSTAQRFADYAGIVAEALGDGVRRWITLNEPQVLASHGYRGGVHAPGLRDEQAATAATHHLLYGHGLALEALRAQRPDAEVGITLDLHPVRVLGEGIGDGIEAARLATEAEQNGLFLEPLLRGRYPAHARSAWVPSGSLIADGDMEVISTPIDFLGINYYAPVYLRAGDPDDLRRNEEPASCELPGVVEYRPEWLERTAMGWLVDAEALAELLARLAREAPGLDLYITENGCAAEDYVDPAGEVRDYERIRYLHDHLSAVGRAIGQGARVAGYFVWSLLDNFEWGWGYQKRFGIVYVDFATQRRVPKLSSGFYSEMVRANAVPPLPPEAAR